MASVKAWAVYRGETTYEIELRFKPEAAKIVTETQWHHTQRVTKHRDGSVTLEFTVAGLEEILNWLLTWTGRVRIRQPAELKILFREKLRAGLNDCEDMEAGEAKN